MDCVVYFVLFKTPRTTDTVLIVLIVVVLTAIANTVEVLVPRVVLWIA